MAPLHGAPGAWEPRFIEPPEPPVPTPLVTEPSTHCPSHEFGIAANKSTVQSHPCAGR